MKSEELVPKDLPKVSTRTLAVVGIVTVLVFAGLFAVGFWPRYVRVEEREALAREIQTQKPVVQVVKPKPSAKDMDLKLPADVRSYAATALYARINGYLAFWKVDIDDRVKKGDILAVISAPDLDADLRQAEANLEQAKANVNQQQTNFELADATLKRYSGLIPTGGVTQQQLDQHRSTFEQAKAALIAGKASVQSSTAAVERLRTLTSFESIVAPFDGVVTSRHYDSGALISASNIGPGQQLFDIAEDDRLRVSINVPQAYATLVKPGQEAILLLERNYPGHRFRGVVTRSAGVLDPETRTLRTEAEFVNEDPKFRILPGMYGQVVLRIERDQPLLTVPTSAMLFEADGRLVAVVRDDNRIHFVKILPGNDLGTRIEVLSGLDGSELVVANPGQRLVEGLEVSVADAPAEEPRKGS